MVDEVIRSLIYVFLIMPSVVMMFVHSVIYFLGGGKSVKRGARAGTGLLNSGVSVVVPVKNEPEHIVIELIENLSKGLSELRNDYEVLIVCDDPPEAALGLKKASEEHASRLGLRNFRFIIRTEGPKGRATALNYGILNSKYDLILFLDVDSRIREDTIPKLISCIESGHDACVARWVGYSYRKTKLGVSLTYSMKYVVDTLYRGRHNLGFMIFPLGTGTMYRKDVLLKVGLWERNVIQDDMYMGTKLHGAGYLVGYSDEALVEVSVPSSFKAFTVQQTRWAFGAIETLKKGYLKYVVKRSRDLGLLRLVEGTLFLLQYIPLASLSLSLILIPALSILLRDDLMRMNVYFLTAFSVMTVAYGLSIYESLEKLKLPKLRILKSMGSIAAFTVSISPHILTHTIKALLDNRISYIVTPKGEKELESGRDTNLVLFATYLTATLLGNLIIGNYFTSMWVGVFLAGIFYTFLKAEKLVHA
jgi:cellulose synthase/poly-beta-1,6-N-acetylglucosamine synthase-like glycosyltransferase